MLRFLAPLTTISGRLARGELDLEQPATLLNQMEAGVDQVVSRLDDELLSKLGTKIQTGLGWQQLRPFEPEHEPARTSRLQSLFDFFDAIDDECDHSTFFIVANSRHWERFWLERYILVRGQYRRLNRLTGERRANLLASVFMNAVEVALGELAEVVYEAECFRRRRKIAPHQALGARLNCVVHWTASSLPNFFDPRSVALRNAFAHATWSYDPRSSMFRLFTRGETEAVCSSELEQLVEQHVADVAMLSDVFDRAVAKFVRLTASLDLLRVFDARVDDAARQAHGARIARQIEERLEPVLKRLKSIGWIGRRRTS